MAKLGNICTLTVNGTEIHGNHFDKRQALHACLGTRTVQVHGTRYLRRKPRKDNVAK